MENLNTAPLIYQWINSEASQQLKATGLFLVLIQALPLPGALQRFETAAALFLLVSWRWAASWEKTRCLVHVLSMERFNSLGNKGASVAANVLAWARWGARGAPACSVTGSGVSCDTDKPHHFTLFIRCFRSVAGSSYSYCHIQSPAILSHGTHRNSSRQNDCSARPW